MRPDLPRSIARCGRTSPLLLALALVACGPDEPPAPPGPTAGLVVTTTNAANSEITRDLVASGSVAAWQEMSLGVELAGIRAAEVLVEVGDEVEAGDPLVRLDRRTLEVQARQAEASLAQANASLALARGNARRGESLVDEGLISNSELDQLRADELRAEAELTTAQANLEEARLRLSFATLRAPDAGLISARSVQPGQVITTGTELLRLIRQGRLEWRAELAERDLTRVAEGETVIITAPNGETVAGKVRTISPAIDPESRSGLVYADLPNPGPLRAGMFAQGRIFLGVAAARVLPSESIVFRDGFPYVFVVSPLDEGSGELLRVERRRITTGSREGKMTEVISGLSRDERVVLRGAGFLSDGDIVREALESGEASVMAQ
jgi:RND family efflux transporter MFP subunit